MNLDVLPDIPKLYTALAEWLACLIYIIPLRKRVSFPYLISIVLAIGITISVGQLVAGTLPIVFWIPSMLMAMLLMFLFIYFCCDVSILDAGYCFTRAFIAAEFAASFEWQVDYYLLQRGMNPSWLTSVLTMVLIYTVVFLALFFIDSNKMPQNRRLGIKVTELFSALLVAFATFLMSNIHFVLQNAVFLVAVGASVLYVRTLVDLAGLTMLIAQQRQRREVLLKGELEAMNYVLHKQYEQYQLSKENIELLNFKYHDLKHMIQIIRQENNPVKRETYLKEMDEIIEIYEAQNKTGNNVLDTVLTGKNLYCAKHKIQMICAVDAKDLAFMQAMDICTIFGNAIDNAVESVLKLEESEKRIIRVSGYTQNNFYMIQFENYFEENISFDNGFPKTTKKFKNYHGFGIKSIFHTVKKYGGTTKIHARDSWFVVVILIPLP